jgi:hypothetical protein
VPNNDIIIVLNCDGAYIILSYESKNNSFYKIPFGGGVAGFACVSTLYTVVLTPVYATTQFLKKQTDKK